MAITFSSGKVVSMESIEKIVKKDMIDPFTSAKIMEKDIIVLQRVSVFNPIAVTYILYIALDISQFIPYINISCAQLKMSCMMLHW